MSTRYSQSPWTLVDVGEIKSADGYVVVEVSGPNRLDLIPQKEANARLIAAAPELLEALELMVDHHSNEWLDHSQPIYNIMKKARAVIAKAIGQP